MIVRQLRVAFLFVVIGAGIPWQTASAVMNRPADTPEQAAEQAATEAAVSDQLRNQPEKNYEFDRAVLRDVLRMLADDAGISFVSGAGLNEDVLVTFTLKASPFRALEVIAKANGVALLYEGGIWYLRPYNDQELIGRSYKLQYDTQESVDNTGTSLNAPTAMGGGTGGTQSSATTPDMGLSLTGATNIFKINPNPMIKEIKALLGLPTEGLTGSVAPEATAGSSESMRASLSAVNPPSPKNTVSNAIEHPQGAQVIWNADSSTLYVLATRQQHQWVAGYLASIDRPQNLIAIEVKFFESTKDPRKQLGLDWSGTLREGYGVKLSNLSARIDANGIVNPSTLTGSAFVPGTAVLSAQDVDVRLRAFLTDHDTSTVSYPRVLTINNREVVIRSVINQPVLASSSSVTPGVGGTTTASVSYLPIGTIINILPKVLADKSVVLNVSVTVSSIIGEQVIEGNSYPIASSRVYTAELHVDSGYTLAIGGLEEALDQRDRNGIPFLKDIPLVGELFKSIDHNRSRKNLMIFITPTMLNPRSTVGIAETPQSVIPVAPNDPTPPAFTQDGMLVGGSAALENAVAWVTRRVRYYDQVVKENRTEKKTLEEISGVVGVCQLLIDQISLMKEARPSEVRRYDAFLLQVARAEKDFQGIQVKAKKDLLNY